MLVPVTEAEIAGASNLHFFRDLPYSTCCCGMKPLDIVEWFINGGLNSVKHLEKFADVVENKIT